MTLMNCDFRLNSLTKRYRGTICAILLTLTVIVGAASSSRAARYTYHAYGGSYENAEPAPVLPVPPLAGTTSSFRLVFDAADISNGDLFYEGINGSVSDASYYRNTTSNGTIESEPTGVQFSLSAGPFGANADNSRFSLGFSTDQNGVPYSVSASATKQTYDPGVERVIQFRHGSTTVNDLRTYPFEAALFRWTGSRGSFQRHGLRTSVTKSSPESMPIDKRMKVHTVPRQPGLPSIESDMYGIQRSRSKYAKDTEQLAAAVEASADYLQDSSTITSKVTGYLLEEGAGQCGR